MIFLNEKGGGGGGRGFKFQDLKGEQGKRDWFTVYSVSRDWFTVEGVQCIP